MTRGRPVLVVVGGLPATGKHLALGLDVVVECVNPLPVTRDAWVSTAAGAGAGIVEVEVVCSDRAEHRRRVLTRASDVQWLVKPNWDDVVGREYHGWDRQHLVVDTARTPAELAAERIAAEVARSRLPASAP